MFRAGLTVVRRVIAAAALLALMICGAEVAVRIYEVWNGGKICTSGSGVCDDASGLTIPSWSFYQELKPMAVARVESRDLRTRVEIHTNSFGLRGPEVTVPKPGNVYRIIVLGDETLFAPETSDTDHFCTLMQDRLQQASSIQIEVVNAAIPGHCPLTEFLLFKHRLLGLQPDLVMLHFDWSDVADDRQIRRRAHCDDEGVPQSCPHASFVTSRKVRAHEAWRQQFRLLDWALSYLGAEWRQQIARQTAVSRESDTNPYAWLRDERPSKNASFRNSVGPVEDLADLCHQAEIPFILMTSPKPWQVSENCSRGEGVRLAAGVAQDACFSNRAPFDVLARFADRSKIPFIDGSPVIGSGRDAESNYLNYAPRWSAAGHLRMAELVTKFLFETTQGPWNRQYAPPQQQQATSHDPPERSIQWAGGPRQNPERIVRQQDRPLR